VASFLVPRVRRVPQEPLGLTGSISSSYIQFLTKPKAYGQIIQVRRCWLAGRLGSSWLAGQAWGEASEAPLGLG
jgi:hypothetical protein